MNKSTITIIAAMTLDGAIGKRGILPWQKIPSEMAHFRKYTLGKPIIMGVRTFLYDLKRKPLPDRYNIVLKKTPPDYHVKDANFVPNLDIALEKVKDYPEIMIIGGASVFKQAVPLADKMILSIIETEIEGADRFFPDWHPDDWKVRMMDIKNNPGELPYTIKHLERKKCQSKD